MEEWGLPAVCENPTGATGQLFQGVDRTRREIITLYMYISNQCILQPRRAICHKKSELNVRQRGALEGGRCYYHQGLERITVNWQKMCQYNSKFNPQPGIVSLPSTTHHNTCLATEQELLRK